MIELSEQPILDQIVERLSGMYREVPPETVSRLVHEEHARFQGRRPIRDFIPLFVERAVRDGLDKLEASAVN